MSVISFAANDLFRFTIIKHHMLNPLDQWANTYEAQATDTGGLAILNLLAIHLHTFEAAFAYDTTVFDRMIIATWEPDSAPYDPANFVTQSLGFTGEVTSPATPLSLSQCLHVTRGGGFGRAGHLFYRNCLSEADVMAPSGQSVLTNQTTTNATIQAAILSSELSDNIGSSPSAIMQLVMVNADGTQVRVVQNLTVAGVSQVKTDHKWYNRTGSP